MGSFLSEPAIHKTLEMAIPARSGDEEARGILHNVMLLPTVRIVQKSQTLFHHLGSYRILFQNAMHCSSYPQRPLQGRVL